jgi:hypothetical protein
MRLVANSPAMAGENSNELKDTEIKTVQNGTHKKKCSFLNEKRANKPQNDFK